MKKLENKLKIAHILHSVGGVDVSLRLILENCDSSKFENIIIHGQDDMKRAFVDNKNKVLQHFALPIYREISFFKDAKSIFKTYKIIKKEKPNLIHAHSAKGGVIARMVGLLLQITVLYTPQAFSYLSTNSFLKRKVFLLIEKSLIFKNNFVLASSLSEKNRAVNEVGYKDEKVILFNNSINAITSINDLTIEKTWPDEYICTVGRPSYQKNIELMIRVLYDLNKTNKIHLVVMGVGHHATDLGSVKNLINELNLQGAVTLIDWTSRENIFHIISKSKLYISTARYEGLPYSIIESLALSKPCIVSDCDGNRDLIENGYNGYVIKNENIKDFVDKTTLLLNDNNLLKIFSKNALAIFTNYYDIKNNILKLEEIYDKFSIK